MKKKYYILLIIISLFYSVNVHACTGSDGCTNCGNSSAEIACKSSSAYKQYVNSNSCESRCKGIQSSTDYDKCMANCHSSSSTSNGKETCYNKCEKYGNETAKTECKKSCDSQYGTGSNSGIFSGGTSSGINPSQNVGSQTEKVTMKPTDTSELNCDSLFGTNTAVGKYVRDIYNIIKFAVPIILLALSIKDFGGGIISQNDNALKVSLMKFGKRLIIAILILVLPTILNFILGLFDIVDPECLL